MSDLSCIQNVKQVHTDPYPYVCVEGALPEARYKELCDTFPMELVTSTTPHDNGICYRYKMKECEQTAPPAIWQDFFAYHTSPEYFRACIELFAPSIETAYGVDFLHNLTTGTVTPRDVDNTGQYVADCWLAVHASARRHCTRRKLYSASYNRRDHRSKQKFGQTSRRQFACTTLRSAI